MGVEYAPASLSLTHDSTELYCTCTYAQGLSVRVAQDGDGARDGARDGAATS